MNYTNQVSLSDLLILHDESEHEITDLAYEYFIPYGNTPKSIAIEFHNALKLNIALGETLLEAMAEEVSFPTLEAIGDQVFPVANCTMPFLKESTRIQKIMAESHDTLRDIEKNYPSLAPQLHIAL